MPPSAEGSAPSSDGLSDLLLKGRELEAGGAPFPTDKLRQAIEALREGGQEDQADQVLQRGLALAAIADREWPRLREALARADELREVVAATGLHLPNPDGRADDPRARFLAVPLSEASLSQATVQAERLVAVLSEAIPPYCVEEAQRLGETIRGARRRGEEVTDAVRRFAQLLAAIQDGHTVAMARGVAEVRRAVARIPRAPSVPTAVQDEEEEILLEARKLARRLKSIKSRARNAQSAARLMTQVRAALSEDRRFGTPEEEIDALWNEVDRLTRERQAGAAAPGTDPTAVAPGPMGTLGKGGGEDTEAPVADPAPADAADSPLQDEPSGRARSRRPGPP